MAEKPILFTGDMVRAILDGSKTQTRRVVRDDCLQAVQFDEISSIMNTPPRYKSGKWVYELQSAVDDTDYYEIKCPYGVPSDLLWVREKWRPLYRMHTNTLVGACFRWRGGGRAFNSKHKNSDIIDDLCSFKPSIHMFKWATQIWLKVKSVWVERVQDISEDDAICEGTQGGGVHPDFWAGAFHDLWDSINKDRGVCKTCKGHQQVVGWSGSLENNSLMQTAEDCPDCSGPTGYGWDMNPWVWVVEFERYNK